MRLPDGTAGRSKDLMHQDGLREPLEIKNANLVMSCLQKDATSKAFIVFEA